MTGFYMMATLVFNELIEYANNPILLELTAEEDYLKSSSGGHLYIDLRYSKGYTR